jgi:hypothetical protein
LHLEYYFQEKPLPDLEQSQVTQPKMQKKKKKFRKLKHIDFFLAGMKTQ